ncbi:hypothetical protein GYMLUDRAFT_41346 [Collybiopsis luxurians FD-317 M1]|uniref:Cytoplasmic tRNA 2-thiolation protein 2 n=1 Tax=Collybiopsis luxurians FD-317 M1 TaxID=944289 RepID=A0A0D0C4J9_9AGAR|nr:hypothetical protein GYMLUDRAFT_41346 [Collybiopsis luxurians FD-317 M1]
MSESCGNPAVETEAIMNRRLKYDRSKLCIKCKVNSGRVVVRHAVYCKDCFPALLTSKVKRLLEPYINPSPELSRRKSLKASGNLLIGYSGGLGSTVLLDLISKIYLSNRSELKSQGARENKPRGGKDHPRNEPVWKKASVCYVEISSAFPGTVDQTDKIKLLVEEKFEALEFISLRLEDSFDRKWWAKIGRNTFSDLNVDVTNADLFFSTVSDDSIPDPVQKLRSYISALPTHTAIDNAIRTLTRILLLYTAHYTQSSHLLLGTSLTSLSISLISSISQGGGFAVREEAQEEWNPGSSSASTPIRLVRPLQEITMKECSLWAWWNNLCVVGRAKHPGSKQGIGALTKDFIVGLERDYPSTVSTIARTCAKLAPKVCAEGFCILCERPLQPGVQDWKSRISIRATTVSPNSAAPIPLSIAPLLCYSCHTTLTSRSSKAVSNFGNASIPLPIWAAVHLNGSPSDPNSIYAEGLEDKREANRDVWVTRKAGPDEMKAVIGDFLLE